MVLVIVIFRCVGHDMAVASAADADCTTQDIFRKLNKDSYDFGRLLDMIASKLPVSAVDL